MMCAAVSESRLSSPKWYTLDTVRGMPTVCELRLILLAMVVILPIPEHTESWGWIQWRNSRNPECQYFLKPLAIVGIFASIFGPPLGPFVWQQKVRNEVVLPRWCNFGSPIRHERYTNGEKRSPRGVTIWGSEIKGSPPPGPKMT